MRGGGGGGVCVDFGFVLHTGLDDPTTAESERSLQKQQGRMEPSDFGIIRQLEIYKCFSDQIEYIDMIKLQMVVVIVLVYRASDAYSHLLQITKQGYTRGQSLWRRAILYTLSVN